MFAFLYYYNQDRAVWQADKPEPEHRVCLPLQHQERGGAGAAGLGRDRAGQGPDSLHGQDLHGAGHPPLQPDPGGVQEPRPDTVQVRCEEVGQEPCDLNL